MGFDTKTMQALHEQAYAAMMAAAQSWSNLSDAGEFNEESARSAMQNLLSYIEDHFITLDYEAGTSYDPGADNMQIKVACLTLAAQLPHALGDTSTVVVDAAKDFYKWVMKTEPLTP